MKHFSVSDPKTAERARAFEREDHGAMTQEGFKKFRRRRSREQAASEQPAFQREVVAQPDALSEPQGEAPTEPLSQQTTERLAEQPSGLVRPVRVAKPLMLKASVGAARDEAVASVASDIPVQSARPAPKSDPDGLSSAAPLTTRQSKPIQVDPSQPEQKLPVSAQPDAGLSNADRSKPVQSKPVAATAVLPDASLSAPEFADAPQGAVKPRQKIRKTPLNQLHAKQPQAASSSTLQSRIDQPRASLPARFDPWLQFPEVAFDFLGQRPTRLPLVSAFRSSPTARAFDLLRTRLIHSLKDHGWKRVAITSPSAGGGTTFCAVNLALSLARVPSSRTILMDMNFRSPGVAAALGIPAGGNMVDFLSGDVAMSDHLQRLSDSLVVATNRTADQDASEILHDQRTADVIEDMIVDCNADTVLFDLPPVLEHDDVTAFLPQVDGVLVISDGDQTTAAQLAACEKMLAGHAPLLGVVLNRAQQTDKTQVTP